MITLLLIALTAYLAFQIGRRWDAGEREAKADFQERQDFERSERRGTIRLNSVRIRR